MIWASVSAPTCLLLKPDRLLGRGDTLALGSLLGI
jgi:hypothetical protein